jgi:acyl-CoA synthetase (AMP-forming)/AMP-acid ligase II
VLESSRRGTAAGFGGSADPWRGFAHRGRRRQLIAGGKHRYDSSERAWAVFGLLEQAGSNARRIHRRRLFRTGDLGRIDEKGYVSITGRAKDLIISGGYNVYPAEVEAVIDELPSVRESAVVGAPHPDFGECVVAFVIPNDMSRPPAAADVIQWVKSSLANYKVPKQVVVVDELPRNTMGKVLKNELRASLVDVSLATAST